jgi:outer membrane protein assembly factor BamB
MVIKEGVGIMIKKIGLPVVFVIFFSSVCSGVDWPGFRGPQRDGKSTETGLLKKWPDGGPKLLWSVEGLGKGYASVSIANGLVYTTGMVGKDKTATFFAFDINGKAKWDAAFGRAWSGSHAGTRTTPTIDGDRLYVMSGHGNVACFDAENGEPVWQVDTMEKFGAQQTSWGISESVLICGNKAICTPGGKDATVVALDKMTGETIWTTKGLSDKSAHCSARLMEHGGKKFIVTVTDTHILGIDSADGTVLFKQVNKIQQSKGIPRYVNPNSPVICGSDIYVTSRFVGGVKLRVNESSTGVSEVWWDKTLDVHHGAVVLVDGLIYGGASDRGQWVCLDWETGKVVWQQKWKEKGSIIYADGMLYCYADEDGTVALVKPSRKGFEIVSSFKITQGDDKHWSHPAISDGRLYIRHGDALMAYDIKDR